METIGAQQIWTFPGKGSKTKTATCTEIRADDAHPVASYMDLAKKVARLQFLNRDFVLMFRGQSADHKNREDHTSLRPRIFRSEVKGKVPSATCLQRRFNNLRMAERELADEYDRRKILGRLRLKRQPILRWSILQHYEVCGTPLLDVTHSLRIAASFASSGNEGEGFIFVLGVPNLSGAVTASAEAGLQI